MKLDFPLTWVIAHLLERLQHLDCRIRTNEPEQHRIAADHLTRARGGRGCHPTTSKGKPTQNLFTPECLGVIILSMNGRRHHAYSVDGDGHAHGRR